MERNTILHVEFNSWSIRRFAHPQIKIFSLPSLKEEYIIAVVEFGELVQLVEFGFGVEFGVFAGMG